MCIDYTVYLLTYDVLTRTHTQMCIDYTLYCTYVCAYSRSVYSLNSTVFTFVLSLVVYVLRVHICICSERVNISHSSVFMFALILVLYGLYTASVFTLALTLSGYILHMAVLADTDLDSALATGI